ncbi:MAG: glycosyltransferase [Bacteroidota bacterium]
MNVFIIPSWYPSTNNPIYGIFHKEQAVMMASERSDWNVGVSMWGQGDDDFLIYANKISSLSKLIVSRESYQQTLRPNLIEYFNPAFTWTRKWRKGNISGIIKANESSLERYILDFGKPDVISAQASYPGSIVARSLSQKYQIPYSVTLRMGPFPFKEFLTFNGQLSKLIDTPLNEASALIATSAAQKSMAVAHGLQDIQVIHDTVDTDFFDVRINESEKLKLLTVCRIEEQKGIDLLLQAASQLETDFELRIGGDGSKKEEYMKLSKKLFGQEQTDKVKWLGELSRDQVKKEMQTCSFYVLPSMQETFGVVLIEAMSCGKPVVATRCGGPQEIVNTQTGILCEISIEGLKSSILEMIKTLDGYDSSAIRTYTIEKFSSSSWIKKVEKVLKSIL